MWGSSIRTSMRQSASAVGPGTDLDDLVKTIKADTDKLLRSISRLEELSANGYGGRRPRFDSDAPSEVRRPSIQEALASKPESAAARRKNLMRSQSQEFHSDPSGSDLRPILDEVVDPFAARDDDEDDHELGNGDEEEEHSGAAGEDQLPGVLRDRWSVNPATTSASLRRTGGSGFSRGRKGNLALKMDVSWREMFITNELALSAQQSFSAEYSVTGQPSVRKKERREITRPKTANLVPILPNSALRISWDLFGIAAIVYDAIMLPIILSWGDDVTPSDVGLFITTMGLLLFWVADVGMNFNTGFFVQGSLELGRAHVFWYYLRTWFFFDILVIAIDAIVLLFGSRLTILRVLRMFRLIRMFKVRRKVSEAVDDICSRHGIRWVILVFQIIGILAAIFLLAHAFACLWYYIGRVEQEMDAPSWLDLLSESDRHSQNYCYIKALYWVLGHLTAAPVDALVTPQNNAERIFTIFSIFSSILVVGSGISSMTNTIAELAKLTAEFQQTKRQLQSYLTSSGVHGDLYNRIMRFALHSYLRRCEMSLDIEVLGLLSDRLKAELALHQRSKHFDPHPLFRSIKETYQEVFRDVCEAFTPQVYADNDIVFAAGRIAKHMYVTHQGEFCASHNSERDTRIDFVVPAHAWICEVGLFARYVHQCSLQATSFADAFTFTSSQFQRIVRESPMCVDLVYRYAQEFLQVLNTTFARSHLRPTSGQYKPVELVSLEASLLADTALLKATQPLSNNENFEACSSEMLVYCLGTLQTRNVPVGDIVDCLPRTFPELNTESGIYARLEFLEERDRALCSMTSILLLLQDRYDDFVAPQDIRKRMSREVWEQWREFVMWTAIDEDQLHAVLFFLAIRGLGKVKGLGKAFSVPNPAPEDIVMYLMEFVVPSEKHLSSDMRDLVKLSLSMLRGFSLPQLLQGENTPCQILDLENAVRMHGELLLKFYLLCQVGVMCGLVGAKCQTGSIFMDEDNSRNLLSAIHVLQEVTNTGSRSAYWSYIISRGGRIGLRSETLEDVALSRLACLCRTTREERRDLQAAWMELTPRARSVLAENCIADGITETAFIFTFLPLFLANAKSNIHVGLVRALAMLVELIDILNLEGCGEKTLCNDILVNMQDIAAFTAEASSPKLFVLIAANIKIIQIDKDVQLVVSTQLKERAKVDDILGDNVADMPGLLGKVLRKVDRLENYLLGSDPVDIEAFESDSEDEEPFQV